MEEPEVISSFVTNQISRNNFRKKKKNQNMKILSIRSLIVSKSNRASSLKGIIMKLKKLNSLRVRIHL